MIRRLPTVFAASAPLPRLLPAFLPLEPPIRCTSSSTSAGGRGASAIDGDGSASSGAPVAAEGGGGRGYRSIGSFHSESVEVLSSLPDDEYVPPPLPFDDGCTPPLPPPIGTDPTHDYGPDFLLDRPRWSFLNHGAFGAALKGAHAWANLWRSRLESQPLRYFDRDLLPHLVHATRSLAKFVHGRRDSLALVQSATVGLNGVVGGYARHFGRDATVLYFDVSYGSVKKMIRHYIEGEVGGTAVEVPFQDDHLPLPSGQDCAEACFVEALDRAVSDVRRDFGGHKLRNALLILDQTTSNTAINVPIISLARRAKEEGMLVLVDGAHGLLAHDLDMAALTEAGVDFYVGNCHKWLCSPRGAAMLYCASEDLRETVLRRPPIVSHGVDDGFLRQGCSDRPMLAGRVGAFLLLETFLFVPNNLYIFSPEIYPKTLSRWIWDGARDYAAQLSIPAVIDYWNHLGPDEVRALMRSKLECGVQILSDLWHPNLGFDASAHLIDPLDAPDFVIAPMSLHSPMALVRLPDGLCGNPAKGGRRTSADAKVVQDYLFDNLVEVPIKCIGGILYVRVSARIYNTQEEFDRLGRALLKFQGLQ